MSLASPVAFSTTSAAADNPAFAHVPAGNATLSFEVEIGLSGDYQPYEPETGPTYACGGTPSVDAGVDGVAIVSLGSVERTRNDLGRPWGWKTVNLLDGVNTASPDIQRLFANILALKGDEAREAVLTHVEDRL